ncbi:ABC transporter substrate-binding protein [Kribbella solani]|uniref:ABC transporter substrate-binding protein n=1 Tax=Kribbella solani TaxID=236067 RepID=UPI0029A1CB58|nr:ABC transporter substrate-binding protein [Kribbella solani]MDX2972657.1 ABC transporter substrate-binding protein [Kribbella solani]
MTARTKRRTFLVLASSLVAATGLAACGGSGDAATGGKGSGPYRVYVSIDLSGPTKSYSEPIVAGLELAADRLNKDGGILGRKIEVEAVDDQNNPTKAVSLLQKRLSDGNKPDLVYAGGASSVSLSLLPVLSRNKILSMAGTVSNVLNDPAKFPYHFSVSPPGSAYAPAFAKEARAKGFKKIAMLFSNDATGQSTLKLYQDALKESGIALVSAGYEAGALDMTSQLQQLKAQDPDALVVNGYGTAALYAFRGRAQIGWYLPTYGDQLSSSFPLVKNLKASDLKDVKVVMSSTSVADGNQSPLFADLVAAIKQGKHAAILPQMGYGIFLTGYDLLELVNVAAGQAKSVKGEDVTKALQELKQPDPVPWLASGKSADAVQYAYSSSNHFPTAGPGLLVFVDPGSYNADGLYEPGKY